MPLPTIQAAKLEEKPMAQRWLIEGLWVDQGVGIIGGQPKCCKSFLGLDMAVAIASGAPCLRRYQVKGRGRVLLFAAEDAQHVVRRRLWGICHAAGQNLEKLDIEVITVPVLRLDDNAHRTDLTETVKALKPKVLILDPFIRMHRIDENNSGEVGKILAYLRALNRTFNVAVALVHHAKKRSDQRAGQSLRGSSEFHAWGDSNIYLARNRDDSLTMQIEHRSEQSEPAVPIKLHQQDEALALEMSVATDSTANEPTVEERVYSVLRESPRPVSLDVIRQSCGLRRATVNQAVKVLLSQGSVAKDSAGYQAVRA